MPKRKAGKASGKRANPVRESRWMRVYQVKPNLWSERSRFLTDGLQLKSDQFENLWKGLSPREKVDFCAAYSMKPVMTEDDEEILNYLIQNGDEDTWSSLAGLLTRHPDRKRILTFFQDRIEKQSPPIANFYQAMEMLSDTDAVEPLLRRYQRYHKEVVIGANRLLCIDYLTCCRTLWKLTGEEEYRQVIEEYLHSDDKFVGDAAKWLLRS